MKFCFTYQVPDGTTAAAAQAAMLLELEGNQDVVYGVFQQEEGTHKHLQGCFRFKTDFNRSCDYVREHFPMLSGASVSCCNNWEASIKYCQKEDTRIPGSTPSIFGDVSYGACLEKHGNTFDHYWGCFYYDDLFCRELIM